jgi:hypothetical protein
VSAGADGDLLMTFADHAVYHVTASGDVVLCAPADAGDHEWLRELLDTVLWMCALAQGREALHASAVETPEGVLAVTTSTGGGKTSFAAELLRRGALFFTDDVLVLERAGGGVLAHPGTGLMNLPGESVDEVPEWLGEPVAAIDDEVWVSVARPASSPRPLAGICFLERRPEHAEPSVGPLKLGPFDLRRQMFAHPFYPQGEAARFEVCAELLATVPIWKLQAPESAPVEELVDVLSTLPTFRPGLALKTVA